MKSVTLGLVLFSNIASANYLFDQFNDTYKVASRWCASGDSVCENVVEVTIGFDQKQNKNFVIEKATDNSVLETWIYEGSSGGVNAFVTGTIPTDASWTESGKSIVRGISLNRSARGAPVMFQYQELGPGSKSYNRRYRLTH